MSNINRLNHVNIYKNCLEASDNFNNTESNIPIDHSMNLMPMENYNNTSHMLQSDKKHTVVVLIDDPEQQRQMMMEQELEDNEKLEMLRQQTASNTYQNLTTVTVLNLEPGF